MLDKKIFIRCLIGFVIWVIGQIIILNIHLDAPHIVSRVWGILCIVLLIVINVAIGFKKDKDE
ncbi:MAG: hypothetical protein UDO63_04840 [Oscillospiraceae bacterium]